MSEIRDDEWVDIHKTVSNFSVRIIKIVLVLIISVGFDLALSIAFFIGLERTNTVLNENRVLIERIQKIDTASIAACLSSNEQALNQHALWDGILALPSDQPPTPEQEARTETFTRLLDNAFKQKDCSE